MRDSLRTQYQSIKNCTENVSLLVWKIHQRAKDLKNVGCYVLTHMRKGCDY